MSPAATSCGVWRWPVKPGSDADRFKVDKAGMATTIHHLRSLKAPSSFVGFQRRRFRGAERHTWQLSSVRLTAYRIEDDSDIHLVIRNAAGKTMIAEIPRPGCVSRKSLWRSQIAAARKVFMARDHATTSWKHVHQRITIRGLGFFDEIHDVTGQAPDGVQLWGNWVLRSRETWTAVGTVQAPLPARGPAAGPAEIAWVVATAAQGRGYAKEAARSLADRLSHAGWSVEAYIHPRHLASQHVARAARMVPTAAIRNGEQRWIRPPAEPVR